jgi:hypothetical protein
METRTMNASSTSNEVYISLKEGIEKEYQQKLDALKLLFGLGPDLRKVNWVQEEATLTNPSRFQALPRPRKSYGPRKSKQFRSGYAPRGSIKTSVASILETMDTGEFTVHDIYRRTRVKKLPIKRDQVSKELYALAQGGNLLKVSQGATGKRINTYRKPEGVSLTGAL